MLTILHNRTSVAEGPTAKALQALHLHHSSDSNALISYSDWQLLELARKARQENRKMGTLWKRRSHETKDKEAHMWRPKYFVLYQNLLFIYASERDANGVAPPKPLAVWLLEGCTYEKLLATGESTNQSRHAFAIVFSSSSTTGYSAASDKGLILAAGTEDETESWVAALRECNYWHINNEYQSYKERYELSAQVLETERISKWNYVVQLDEAHEEIKRLRWALAKAKSESSTQHLVGKSVSAELTEADSSPPPSPDRLSTSSQNSRGGVNDDELRSIRKVQSLMRGWLCRHRWKAIVEEYVRSPHADKMRQRNKIIFRMVKEEREYVDNLSVLVASFLQPLKMAASSSFGGGSASVQCTARHQHEHGPHTIVSHEEVSAVFLNCQTLLFLHQIFLQGLSKALDKWPQLIIGDVFELLLPALSVYTEYVRNHYVSVQTLAELKMTRPALAQLIRQMELKTDSIGDSRSLENLLTCPMNQIPRYILNFHELLAYTMHNHVDRPNLEAALAQLEDLSLQMSTEMSESEHIRKNLSIERMIGEGGQVLLDPDEVLVRQGALLLLEQPNNGSISLPQSHQCVTSSSVSSMVQSLLGNSLATASTSRTGSLAPRTVFLFSHYLIITTRSPTGKLSLVKHNGIIPLNVCMLIENSPLSSSTLDPPGTSTVDNEFSLVADCKDNGTCVLITFRTSSSREKQLWCSDITQCLEKIHFDEVVVETWRYFNDSGPHAPPQPAIQSTVATVAVAAKLARKAKSKTSKEEPEKTAVPSVSRPVVKQVSLETLMRCLTDFRLQAGDFINVFLTTYRLFTTGERVLQELSDAYHHWRQFGSEAVEEMRSLSSSNRAISRENVLRQSSPMRYSPQRFTRPSQQASPRSSQASRGSRASSRQSTPALQARSSQTSTAEGPASRPSCPAHVLSQINERILPAESGDLTPENEGASDHEDLPIAASPSHSFIGSTKTESIRRRTTSSSMCTVFESRSSTPTHHVDSSVGRLSSLFSSTQGLLEDDELEQATGSRSSSLIKQTNPGMIVFSVSQQRRRMSSAVATQAFARATAGALDLEVGRLQKEHEKQLKADQVLNAAQCLNIFSILRHWSVVFPEDLIFGETSSNHIGEGAAALLSEMACDTVSFAPNESAAICKLMRYLTDATGASSMSGDPHRKWLLDKVRQKNDDNDIPKQRIGSIMEPLSLVEQRAATHCSGVFDSLPAIDVAEQMTFIDCTLFRTVKLSEIMNQAWTKPNKEREAPTVTLITSHFNHVSSVVVTNIVSQPSVHDRANAIKKWLQIASTCYGMHNFNGALQVVSALQSSAVFRLKKTWDKVPKQTRHSFEKLSTQLSAENRFKQLREKLRSIDPPCTPYLGMYLHDLTLIDEGCPTFVKGLLVNFSKMKMIYQVVSQIQTFQSVTYKIAPKPQIIDQLLDQRLALDDDSNYHISLTVEPRQSHVAH